jgi:hypothetical protein
VEFNSHNGGVIKKMDRGEDSYGCNIGLRSTLNNNQNILFTFIFSFSISTVLIMKSTPIVAPCPGGNNP